MISNLKLLEIQFPMISNITLHQKIQKFDIKFKDHKQQKTPYFHSFENQTKHQDRGSNHAPIPNLSIKYDLNNKK